MSMPVFEVPLGEIQGASLDADKTSAITKWLITQGYVDPAVTVQLEPYPALIVDTDHDPTADITSWTPQPTEERDAALKARTLALTYRDKVLDGQAVTAAETQKALAATITMVERLAQATLGL